MLIAHSGLLSYPTPTGQQIGSYRPTGRVIGSEPFKGEQIVPGAASA